MRTSKSPQQRKQGEYDRDTRPLVENPHAFRTNWRKKKRREHRRDRVALRSVMATAAGEELTAAGVSRLRRRQRAIKSFVMTLRQRVAFNHARRERVGMHGNGSATNEDAEGIGGATVG